MNDTQAPYQATADGAEHRVTPMMAQFVEIKSANPDCHWLHAVAMRTVFETMVSVLQCLRNSASCPSLWRTHHGIIPHPAKEDGAYLMDK